jgi:hypothetical protein
MTEVEVVMEECREGEGDVDEVLDPGEDGELRMSCLESFLRSVVVVVVPTRADWDEVDD